MAFDDREGTARNDAPGVTLRSAGPLTADQLKAMRANGDALNYDPLQTGWVKANCIDDFDPAQRRSGWPSVAQAASRFAPLDLRPWTTSDVPAFQALLDNPAVWIHLPAPYPGEIDQQMAFDLIDLSQNTDLHVVRAIVLNGHPVGQVRLEFTADGAELSYWLGEPFWGRGIATRAVSRFVAEQFEADKDLSAMIARVKPENAASLRLLESLGFHGEGLSNAAPDWLILRKERS